MTDTVGRTWNLSRAGYLATVEKIAKINARAIKKGFTGTIEVVGEPFVIIKTNELGLEVAENRVKTTIIGEPAHYDGWSFQAVAEWDSNAGLIIRSAPGAEKVNRDALIEGHCDHCRINRYRKETYIIRNGDEQKQVGSSCLKDFLPSGISPVFIDLDSIGEEIDKIGGGYVEPDYKVSHILAIAWAAIKTYGWAPSSSYDKIPTKIIVTDFLTSTNKAGQEYRTALIPLLEDMESLAKEVRDFILSDEFSGDSEYVLNLKAIIGAEYVNLSKIGILVSAPQALFKAQEKSLIQKVEKKESNWVGKVGDKITVTATLEYQQWFDGYTYNSPSRVLYKFLDADGNLYVWWSSRDLELENGKSYTFTTKIKNHSEFRDIKQTEIYYTKMN